MGIVIIGAGGFGREILDVIDASPIATVERDDRTDHMFACFVDDGTPDLAKVAALGERVLGGLQMLTKLRCTYLIGVGNPATRRLIDERALGLGRLPYPMVMHSTAAIGRSVDLGAGAVVCAHAALTTNIVAGRHLHVNLGATIGHDCVIGDYVTLAPGVNVSGNVTIGDEVEFGTGAQVLPGLAIGAGARVGAGAVVTRDVEPGTTVIGVPAKPRR